MSIRSQLVPVVLQRFRKQGTVPSSEASTLVRIPAAHPSVGDVTVLERGNEVVVVVGNLAHAHFSAGDAKLQSECEVIEDIVAFLEDLFEDRVVLWSARGGAIGGWARLDNTANAELPSDAKTFKWSGPIQ